VLLPTGQETQLAGPIEQYDGVSQGELNHACDNLEDLENFGEGIILHHVQKRYASDVVYTHVGSILVAMNPYKSLQASLYTVDLMEKMLHKVKNNLKTPPHVFSTGAMALHAMRTEQKDQAVLISGESGAGKTETTKKILQFLSTMTGSTASRTGVSVEVQILDSNPILEAFGNAKTLRNNNSSRFGKYMEVNFDPSGRIKGCNVTSYLLEKSRVVKQTANERNYHIFYMLLAGASKELKQELMLRPAQDFDLLNQSGCIDVDRRNEKEEYDVLVRSFGNLSINATTQKMIFQCVAGVLHLGNISFSSSSGGARDSLDGASQVSNQQDLRRVATLLGINAEALEQALCCRENNINGEIIYVPLNPVRAGDQRDALIKNIYGKLFDFIVSQINTVLLRGKPGNNIGVLDIFGFEVFRVNRCAI